jgi:hypothetical protein
VISLVSGSEIVIAPGSGKALTRSLLDKNNQPVDFSVGTWRADLFIIEYPGDQGIPFQILSTQAESGRLQWITLNNSSVIITPDPDVTESWNFYKYHYELFVQGPNFNSEPERVDHGSFRLDR